jgi:hypothetical protein
MIIWHPGFPRVIWEKYICLSPLPPTPTTIIHLYLVHYLRSYDESLHHAKFFTRVSNNVMKSPAAKVADENSIDVLVNHHVLHQQRMWIIGF